MEAYSPPTLIDKSPSVATAILVLIVLSLIVFPLRVYVRLTNRAWGTDDTLMSLAAVCVRKALLRKTKGGSLISHPGALPGTHHSMSRRRF